MSRRGYVSDAEWAWFKKLIFVCVVAVVVSYMLLLSWL